MRIYENGQERFQPLAMLEELSRLRQRPALLLCGANLSSPDTATMLYTFLRQLGHQKALDVVFQCPGGHPAATRQLAVLLREFTDHLTILVMQHAHSAGALFCLAADELIMSPLSTLSPIDPQMPGQLSGDNDWTIMPGREKDSATPRGIATEEMRLFREMASAWFGVGETVEERLSLLHTFASRIFPTTLTALFRADQEMRQVANELLRYHQPDAIVRQRISDQLTEGFFSHAHVIHRQEARELGLNVVHATGEEETCLWRLLGWWQAYHSFMRPDLQALRQKLWVRSVLVGDGFAAHDIVPLPSVAPAHALATQEGSPDPSTSPVLPRRPEQNIRWGWQRIPLDILSQERYLPEKNKEEQYASS